MLVMRFDAARWSRAHAAGARSLLRDLGGAESGPVASEGMLGQIGAATPAERRTLLETRCASRSATSCGWRRPGSSGTRR